MKVEKLEIEEVLLITPSIYEDERGHFLETFNEARFNQETGLNISFIQDNESFSTKGVLRGLHYQISPKAQSKLVRVVLGEIFDVAVDMREDSPSFGNWVGVKLDAIKKQQLFVPKGFAHGFLVLSEKAVVAYKCDEFYSKENERSVRFDDKDISIDWSFEGDFVLSDKDKDAPLLKQAETFNSRT